MAFCCLNPRMGAGPTRRGVEDVAPYGTGGGGMRRVSARNHLQTPLSGYMVRQFVVYTRGWVRALPAGASGTSPPTGRGKRVKSEE